MSDAPKPHNPTLLDNLRSAILWTIGGSVFVVGTALILLLSLFVGPTRLEILLLPLVKLVVRLTGLRLRVSGLEKLDPKQPYVFICNHVNFFDHFAVYSVLNRCLRGVEKESNFRMPVYGLLLRRMGQVPIKQRGDTQGAIEALKKVQLLLKEGVSLFLLPEGTRSVTGELGPFKKGAFHLAVDTQVPLVPITLKGMIRFNRKNDWRIYPTTVDMVVDDPIPTAGLTKRDIPPLVEKSRATILKRLGEA